jgi:hypothetical protein
MTCGCDPTGSHQFPADRRVTCPDADESMGWLKMELQFG